ncbi:MAG TPA: DUF1697 domain-containing protein [Nocardioidaceae bacterium]|nr:DUF1697 domain-containing protein [Nocardioidaceae bacterium]
MPHHIAFLRAVNVGKRQVRMAALREWLTADGFTDVETHIQTGNVRVGTSTRSAAKVEQRLEELLLEKCGFEVPCIMFTPTHLRQVYDDALAIEPPPYADRDDARRYVVFFKDAPTAEQVAACAAYEAEVERAWIIGRAAHIWTAGGMADAKLFGALDKIFSPGTNRNLTVVKALVEKWC